MIDQVLKNLLIRKFSWAQSTFSLLMWGCWQCNIFVCSFQNIPASERLVRGKRKSAILRIQVLTQQIIQQ